MENPSSSNAGRNANGEYRGSNARPESSLALDFSSTLDGAFNLNEDLVQLGNTVQEKKETVKSQSQELQELEARLKQTEERLKKAGVQQTSTASGQQETRSAKDSTVKPTPSMSSPPSRPPPGRPGVLAARSSSLADRVPTPLDPRNAPMPGALPETPSEQQSAADYYEQRRA